MVGGSLVLIVIQSIGVLELFYMRVIQYHHC